MVLMRWVRGLIGGGSDRSAAAGRSPGELLAAGAVLVDVRQHGEFAAGHIEGALWVPLDRIEQDIAAAVPDRARTLLLYCQSGMRSQRACAILRRLGYADVVNGGGIGRLAVAAGRRIAAGK